METNASALRYYWSADLGLGSHQNHPNSYHQHHSSAQHQSNHSCTTSAATAVTTAAANATMITEQQLTTPAESILCHPLKNAINIYIVLLLCIFGISGNVVSILVLGKDRVVRRTTGFLLQVLAFTDLIYLVACLMFQTVEQIAECTDWNPGLKYTWRYMKPFVWPFASVAQTCTTWLVVVVTVDRYVAICKPLHAPQYSTMTRMRKTVLAVWCLSIIYNIPRVFERETIEIFNNITNTTDIRVIKTTLRKNNTYVVLYKTFLFFITRFCVPLTSLSFFNWRLIHAIKVSYKRRKEMPQADYRNQTNHHRKEKYSLTLVVVVVVFIICETPDFVLRIWVAVYQFWPGAYFPRAALLHANIFSNLMLTINSCSNFVIYCFIGTRFRRLLVQLLCKPKKSRHETTYRITTNWVREGEEMTILVSH